MRVGIDAPKAPPYGPPPLVMGRGSRLAGVGTMRALE